MNKNENNKKPNEKPTLYELEVNQLYEQINKERYENTKDLPPECSKCRQDGRLKNSDPMLSNHNCWKYS